MQIPTPKVLLEFRCVDIPAVLGIKWCYNVFLLSSSSMLMSLFPEPSKSTLGLREAGVLLAPCNILQASRQSSLTPLAVSEARETPAGLLICEPSTFSPHLLFPKSSRFPTNPLPVLRQAYQGHENNDPSNVSSALPYLTFPVFLSFCQACEVSSTWATRAL